MTTLDSPDQVPKHKFFTLNLILRFILLGLSFAFVFTIGLISILGYRINLRDVSFSPGGIIQVNTWPSNATVSVNDRNLFFLSNNRVGVDSGNYDIKVSRDGYHTWHSVLPIKNRSVWWPEARLVPEVKQVATVKTYNNLLASYASPNRKWLLTQTDKNLFELVDISPDKPSFQTLNFSVLLEGLTTENDIRFLDWNLSADTLFFRDVSELGAGKTYAVTMNGTAKISDLSSLFPNIIFSQIKVSASDGKTLFVASGSDLYRINLDRPGVYQRIATNVAGYRILSQNQIVFLDYNDDKSKMFLKLYDHSLAQSFKIEQLDYDATTLFEAFENKYDGFGYVALYHAHKFYVWSSNFNNLVVKTSSETVLDEEYAGKTTQEKFQDINPDFRQAYSAYIESVPASLTTASDGRFLLLDLGAERISLEEYQSLQANMLKVSGTLAPTATPLPSPEADSLVTAPYHQFKVVDMSYRLDYDVNLAVDAGSRTLAELSSGPSWLNNDILWENLFGVVRFKDYNGQNQHKIIPADNNFDIQLSSNEKYLYFYQNRDGKILFRRLKMLLN